MATKTDMSRVELDDLNSKYKKSTESVLKDGVYSWIIDRYTRNSRLFEFSDRFVWSGGVYVIPEFIGYLVFFALFYWLGNIVLKYGSVEKLFMFFMLLLLWRVNILVKYVGKISRKLEGRK